MTDAAIYFAWVFGLSDWRTAQALGTSENAVRLHRRALGLKKTGGGQPLRIPSGEGVPPTGTMKSRPRVRTATGWVTDERCSMTIAETRLGRKRDSYARTLPPAQVAGRAGA